MNEPSTHCFREDENGLSIGTTSNLVEDFAVRPRPAPKWTRLPVYVSLLAAMTAPNIGGSAAEQLSVEVNRSSSIRTEILQPRRRFITLSEACRIAQAARIRAMEAERRFWERDANEMHLWEEQE